MYPSIIRYQLESFKIEIDESGKRSEENYRQGMELLPNIFTPESENLDWLIERTEKWCQDRSVYNAVMESILSLTVNTQL